MKSFTQLDGLVVSVDRANVDTDAIIPKQFLKSIKRTGFGDFLFDEWRYHDHGEPGMDCTHRPRRTEFSLNQERYRGATILLARENFGCGSSREHAVWALEEYGIRCMIAPSFADIFFSNSFKSGLLPIKLDADFVERLFREVEATPGYRLTVDLAAQTVKTPGGETFGFEVDPFRKECLLNGWDDIGLTLRHADEIRAYENRRRQDAPWLFA
ncbi:MAG: 3-isopropylmalate dehydratase small subunit [Candidatus Competibacteraceae bacterium]|nr:3-isopropylmalate dehydratase small subunit [Candidatus Competibacteraceae bacterium]MBK9952141.1 3-isopropylmalate dehydratase small subunit [Candidatus Competibacteraceae bacterium]